LHLNLVLRKRSWRWYSVNKKNLIQI